MELEPDLVANKNVCWSTPQGWILVISPSPSSATTAWLWNPRTKNRIVLPDLEEDHGIPMGSKCLVTHSDATHPECLVALFDYKEPNMRCCKVGGGDGGVHGGGWSRYKYDIGDYEERSPAVSLLPKTSSPASPRFKGRSSSSAQQKTCAPSASLPRLITNPSSDTSTPAWSISLRG